MRLVERQIASITGSQYENFTPQSFDRIQTTVVLQVEFLTIISTYSSC